MVVGRQVAKLGLGLLLLLPLASCANSPWAQVLQNSLAADPRLSETAPEPIAASPASSPTAELPADFPTELPRYPNATLQQVLPAPEPSPNPAASPAPSPVPSEVTTLWQTPDDRDRVLTFYREQLSTNGWTLEQPSLISTPGTLVAMRSTPTPMIVTISVPPNSASPDSASPNSAAPDAGSPSPETAAATTQITIRYPASTSLSQASPVSTASPSLSPTPTASPSPTTASPSPTADIEVFLGAEGTAGSAIAPPSATPAPIAILPPNQYTDLETAPAHLRAPITDLAQLGVLNLAPTGKSKTGVTQFTPNKPISRREFARWLFEANNRLFSDRPAQQIRPGSPAAPPAFRDVPASDPDFAAIQGLAEAGIIPSALSNDGTGMLFQPDAQLSREALLLWKVPMDLRQPLPNASLDMMKQTWGFQDAARIDPKAQRAIVADFQNGDMSNIRRVFGYTTLFQPKRPVSRAEAAAALWYFGYQSEGVSAQAVLNAQTP